jgi:nucleotide-binding universal stress UspA family protein
VIVKEDTVGFQRILVPIDFSEHSEQALEMARELAKAFNAKLLLLHCYQVNPGAVSPYGIVLPENFDREVREAAARRLDEWREKASADGVDVEAHLSSTFPSMGIVDAAVEARERCGAHAAHGALSRSHGQGQGRLIRPGAARAAPGLDRATRAGP